jgi:hypothetical protein
VEPVWVSSLGGPLILIPQSACHLWGGAPLNYPEDEGDYGRACEANRGGHLGLVDVCEVTALVLGGYPAETTFVPALNVFVRAVAMDDDADAEVMARDLLPGIAWQETVYWSVTETVILFDSVYSGLDLAANEHLRVDLAPGRYTVRAVYVEPPDALPTLVHLARESQ